MWLDFLEGLERLIAAVELLWLTRESDDAGHLPHALPHAARVGWDLVFLGIAEKYGIILSDV